MTVFRVICVKTPNLARCTRSHNSSVVEKHNTVTTFDKILQESNISKYQKASIYFIKFKPETSLINELRPFSTFFDINNLSFSVCQGVKTDTLF